MEEVFHDANDFFPQEIAQESFIINNHKFLNGHSLEEYKKSMLEVDDPPIRYTLPYLRNPKIKLSIWTILKDAIGKDLTKISVPVYFNGPTSHL